MSQDETGISQLDLTELEETTLDHWLNTYRQMLKIRLFEEKTNELYTSAKMPGLAHLYTVSYTHLTLPTNREV